MNEIIKPIAYYTEGLLGIYILNVLDDRIVWKYSRDEFIHNTRIYYDRNSDPYFICYRRAIYLKDCLRTDI